MGQCIIWRDNQHFSKCFPCVLDASLLNERKDKDAVSSRELSIALKGLTGPPFGLLGFSFHQSGSSHPDGRIERIWIERTESDRPHEAVDCLARLTHIELHPATT